MPFTAGNQFGKGRPRGTTKNKFHIIPSIEKLFEEHKEWKTPAQFLIEEMLNPENPKHIRVDCAKSVAPYVHRRMPQAIDGGEDGKPIAFADISKMSQLDDSELERLTEIARKLANTPGIGDGEEETATEQDSEILS